MEGLANTSRELVRNYGVVEMIPKLRLTPGTSIWYRSFLVVHRKDRAAQLARSLVQHVDCGLASFDAETTPTVPVATQRGSVLSGESAENADSAFQLFARPVPDTMPLFLIRHAKTGRQVITSDPYVFVRQKDSS